MTADWIAMQETNTVHAYYYRDADPVSDPDTTIGNKGGSGIFYGNSQVSYKPKSYAFKLWSNIYNVFPKKLSCNFPVVAPDSSKLYVLASGNEQGGYGFLVSNIDSLNKTFDITIDGVTIDTADYNICYFIVNDNNNGDVEMINYSTHFSIPLQSVELIRILPKNYSYVSDSKTDEKIKIYPNPSTGDVNIEDAVNYQAEIFDYTGKKLLTIPHIKQNITTVNLSNFDKGLYFMKFYNKKLHSIKYQELIIN